jgi:hypothetical protein
MTVLSSVDGAGAPEEAGVGVTLAPVLEEEEEGGLEAGVDVTLAPVLEEEEEGGLEAGVDVTPVLEEEEEGVGEAGVDMVPIPVLEEEFEFGGLCATACSAKYIGIKSPNTRINAITVQDVCLIFYYRSSLKF